MPDQRGGDPFVEQDRHRAGGRPAGAQPFGGPLAGAGADLLRRRHVGGEGARFRRPVALHPQALAGDRHGRDRMAGARVAAGKAVARRQPDRPPHMRGVAGFAGADPGHAQRGRLGPQRQVLQRRRIGRVHPLRLGQFQPGHGGGIERPPLGGEADAVIDRRLAGHGDGAGGHLGDRAGRRVRAGDAGLPGAEDHPQPDLDPVSAFGMFQLPGAHVDGRGGGPQGDGIGLVGPRGPRGGQHLFGQLLQRFGLDHAPSFAWTAAQGKAGMASRMARGRRSPPGPCRCSTPAVAGRRRYLICWPLARTEPSSLNSMSEVISSLPSTVLVNMASIIR